MKTNTYGIPCIGPTSNHKTKYRYLSKSPSDRRQFRYNRIRHIIRTLSWVYFMGILAGGVGAGVITRMGMVYLHTLILPHTTRQQWGSRILLDAEEVRMIERICPAKHKPLSRWWFDVGPAPQTLGNITPALGQVSVFAAHSSCDDVNECLIRATPGPYSRTPYDIYIVGFGLVEMAISTNPRPKIYPNLYQNTEPEVDRCCIKARPAS